MATGSPPPDPDQRPQRPPLQVNMGGGGTASTARHTSDSQVDDHLVNTHVPPPTPTSPPVDDIPPTFRQCIHAQEEVEDQSYAFDLINTNDYNTESAYYSSLSFTQLNR